MLFHLKFMLYDVDF